MSQGVEQCGERLYGYRPRVTPLPSNNNKVFRLDFAGGESGHVIKFGRESLLREQQFLRVLSRHGLPVPPVELTQDDVDVREFWPGPWHTLPLLPGTTLGEFTRAHRHGEAAALWRRAGAFPASLGAVPLDELPLRVRQGHHLQFWEKARASFEREEMWRAPFDEILVAVRQMMERTPVALTHGDYGANQIITDGTAFHVIDWESGGEDWELASLSRIIAMAREYGGAEHGGHEQEQIAWLLEGCAEHRPLDAQARRDLHLWEMWQHIGVMSWKFHGGEEHRRHAFAMAERVTRWHEAATGS